ncbi:hypothetical protein HNP52_000028 [Sphingomonas kyeonggiensis]|uniref:Protein NO VEIN C-terminal domain-containing protein n=1 Tax=Sphingomonas kyeonggiensis TaxID=1268553 RepID=A0A7W7JX37_9SPHN|nr:DUF3883 domain-containing protein [Sphingomonas kyeonggiensis]MBB4836977.1 hypothetical protein [Sphingomonas kyeonggiensis]
MKVEPEAFQQPIRLNYEADLLGNIQQALAGLQGFGVMALELIQNADDAGAGTLRFDVCDTALFVYNSAEFSTCGLTEARCPWERDGDPEGHKRACNFHAISRMGSRNKVRVASQIGRFGIGFVSVYQITDAPIVRSIGIEMQLIPIDGAGATKIVPPHPGTEFELAWAAMASDTRTALNASPTPPDVVALVVDAIVEVMTRGLFFLRRLHTIELLENGAPVQSVSIARDGGIVTLEIHPEGRTERWKLFTRNASDLALSRQIFDDFPTLAELDRSPEVTIALPLHAEPLEGLLYAFLPTEQGSGLPLHINADFFPHPTRRMITLSGEQHERYWNELLLDTAARALAENFEEIRDLLGHARFWALANAAYGLRENRSFQSFWSELHIVAKASNCVLTVNGGLARPGDCVLPEQMSPEGQAALASTGLKLLHPDLRSFWTMFLALDASALRLPAVISALEAMRPVEGNGAPLVALWAAVDEVLQQSRTRLDLPAQINRLKAVRFVLDVANTPSTINELWRPPSGISAADIHRLLPDVPIVHEELLLLPTLSETVDLYRFPSFASDIGAALSDEEKAATTIGVSEVEVRRFYDLLVTFAAHGDVEAGGQRLVDVPILRTKSGFVTPSRGQLPGGFVDPIGHFELIDTAIMSERMRALARDVLQVEVLTFKAYVDDHLEEILRGNPSREQYVSLLAQVLEHRAELDAEGGLLSLAERAFVRTRAGQYARPRDCYYWTAAIEAQLGAEPHFFVDEDWMPAGRDAARLQDLLEDRLGMRRTVSVGHLVARIEEIAGTCTIDEIATRTQPIVRHILDRFDRLSSDERAVLERLKVIPWLPASLDGERVANTRYSPALVYRPFRAAGYASQVRIVDLPALRGGTQAGRTLTEFLDFLGMKEEPPTEAVVAHLEHCMANDIAASDVVYAMLSERLNSDDAGCIDRLADKAFIYDPDLKRYLRSDQVFWDPTHFRGHWHAPSVRMRQREALYRRLGVTDAPVARHHLALLGEIAAHPPVGDEDAIVHERCLAWLADALEHDDSETRDLFGGLEEGPLLLNMLGESIWLDEAVWRDSDLLSDPFAGALDERLVAPPHVSRLAAARLFKELRVPRLSSIAKLALAEIPSSVSDPEATERLQSRGDLLLWLAPNAEFRDRLRSILARVEVRRAGSLQLNVEILDYDPPVRSPSSQAEAFFDPESSALYVRSAPGIPIDWTAAFRALFAPLEQLYFGIDMPPVIMTAAFVATLPTWEEAERALRNANYRAPQGEYEDLPETEELHDVEDSVASSEEDESEPGDVGAGVPDGAVGPDADTREDAPTDDGKIDHDGEDLEDRNAEEETEPQRNSAAEDHIHEEPAVDPSSGSEPSAGEAATRTEETPFASRSDDGSFGTESAPGNPDTTPPSTGGGEAYRSRRGPTRAEREQRRSRMLSYVNASPREGTTGETGDGTDDFASQIDLAAIEAVMKYEQRCGRTPVEQPHNNPGFDIVSALPDGASRRLIEVKGLDGEWTERGIKLSHVQFDMARRHPEEYWLYVVEFARDRQNHRVSAIANPFSKVIEYWFDHGWKGAIEEAVAAAELNLEVGVKVRHAVWGVGTIEQINRRGIGVTLLVDFGHEGRKLIPYNSSLEFMN